MTYSTVLLVGAPRSGTTWLQRMLGSHPAIATTQETDLLDGYVCAWLARWDQQLAAAPQNRNKGLPAVLTADEFQRLLRCSVATVYDKVGSLKPNAEIVLDKNPYYSKYAPTIAELLPDSRFLHIVRDGRDVATSMVAASSREWGRSWAPPSIGLAAARWQLFVSTVQAAELPAHRYLEVPYEALLSRGTEELARCLEFCGASADPAMAAEIYRSFTFERSASSTAPDPLLWSGEVARRGAGPPPEPPGFFGEGRAGAWRDTWSLHDRLSFDRVAGDLLVRLGYEPDHAWSSATRRQTAAFVADRVVRDQLRQLRARLRAVARPVMQERR